MKNIFKIFLVFVSSFGMLFAQNEAEAELVVEETAKSPLSVPIFILIILFVLLVGVLYFFAKVMLRSRAVDMYNKYGLGSYLETKKESFFGGVYNMLTGAVPIEKEIDIQLDHNYDGIRELDNDLPPWWLWMFYLTTAFAVVYMGFYHVFGLGMNQQQQYDYQMAEAKAEIEAYTAKQGNLIDENSVVAMTDEASLAKGLEIYTANCVACHLASGGGSVGPNLTDEYWIHGGSINEVFTTIKYGVPTKGMISWQAQLSAIDMQNVASYILSLQGTNPADGKAPDGELYVPGGASAAPAADSTAVDSAATTDVAAN